MQKLEAIPSAASSPVLSILISGGSPAQLQPDHHHVVPMKRNFSFPKTKTGLSPLNKKQLSDHSQLQGTACHELLFDPNPGSSRPMTHHTSRIPVPSYNIARNRTYFHKVYEIILCSHHSLV